MGKDILSYKETREFIFIIVFRNKEIWQLNFFTLPKNN